jgi:formylglycine-generating enzyme required for sulfatase activity
VGNQVFRMILVEAGKFIMGDPDFYSFTQHEVQVDSFYISETEVTNGQWREIVGSLPYDTIALYTGTSQLTKTKLPVSYVSWYDIENKFMPKLKTRKAYNFRLPTEAEWEYAAIGGKHSHNYKYAGSNNAYDVAWYTYENFGTTIYSKKEVKTLLPNELGLYDMSGNVSEWCFDWYADYTADAAKNPKGPNAGTKKVIRGGNYQSSNSWGEILECKVRYRSSAVPGCYELNWPGTIYETKHYRCECVGFRIVIALDKQ